jgi:hypothetical protein
MKKFQAVNDRKITGGPKLNTHLYSFVPSTTGLRDFLPSFTNKFTNFNPRFVPINIATGLQYKTRHSLSSTPSVTS